MCENLRHPHFNVMFVAQRVELLAGYSTGLVRIVRIALFVLWSYVHSSSYAGYTISKNARLCKSIISFDIIRDDGPFALRSGRSRVDADVFRRPVY